jgi:hypothetical protein
MASLNATAPQSVRPQFIAGTVTPLTVGNGVLIVDNANLITFAAAGQLDLLLSSRSPQ